MHYLLTFSCYGSWFHGDSRGSVERQPRTTSFQRNARLERNPALERYERSVTGDSPLHLAEAERKCVLAAICEVARHRDWSLQAAHVRTEHTHVVVEADTPPERILADFKAYATRRLRELGLVSGRRHCWSRGGSRMPLRTAAAVDRAVRYAADDQGPPMALYLAEPRSP